MLSKFCDILPFFFTASPDFDRPPTLVKLLKKLQISCFEFLNFLLLFLISSWFDAYDWYEVNLDWDAFDYDTRSVAFRLDCEVTSIDVLNFEDSLVDLSSEGFKSLNTWWVWLETECCFTFFSATRLASSFLLFWYFGSFSLTSRALLWLDLSWLKYFCGLKSTKAWPSFKFGSWTVWSNLPSPRISFDLDFSYLAF